MEASIGGFYMWVLIGVGISVAIQLCIWYLPVPDYHWVIFIRRQYYRLAKFIVGSGWESTWEWLGFTPDGRRMRN